MAYVTQDQIERAREIDALSFVMSYRPGDLVRDGNGYRLKSHDSLKFSNGKWYWWSRGVGGVSALDYLIKVEDMGFQEAVLYLIDEKPQIKIYKPEPVKPVAFKLPRANQTNDGVINYLMGRGIHPTVLRHCIQQGMLYESCYFHTNEKTGRTTGPHHNAVFVGYNFDRVPVFANVRNFEDGKKRFRQDVPGSNKAFSFCINPRDIYGTNTVHLFESCIDAMSQATMDIMDGKDWQQDFSLVTAGIYPKPKDRRIKIPLSLTTLLEEYPWINEVRIHYNNDERGARAADNLCEWESDTLHFIQELPPPGMDTNDQLLARLNNTKSRTKHSAPTKKVGAFLR